MKILFMLVIAIFSCLTGLYLSHFNPEFQHLDSLDWTGISGVADIAMFVLSAIFLIGIGQTAKSIKSAEQSRNAELLTWAMEQMTELKPEIRIVTDAHKHSPYCDEADICNKDFVSIWKSGDKDAAKEVSIVLQRMGYFALYDLIDKKHFLNLWGPMYLSCWYSLEKFVKHQRTLENEPFDLTDDTYYRIYFEKYARYCEQELPELLLNNTRVRFGLKPIEKRTTMIKKIVKAAKRSQYDI